MTASLKKLDRLMPRQARKRTLATCRAVHTPHDGVSDVSYVLLPLLAQTFGLSLTQVGLISLGPHGQKRTHQ